MSASTVVKKIDALVERIDSPIIVCGIITVSASATLLFVGVILRYIFGTTSDIIEELSSNLVVWSVMFLGGPAFKRGSHVGMEFLAEKLKGRLRAFHHVFINLVLFVMCGVLCWKGLEVVQLVFQSGRTTISGEIPLWFMMIPVPIGAFIFCFYLISEITKSLCVFIDPALYDNIFPSRTEVPQAPDGLAK
ncbi:MAG: TRAP transporter small permease [Deltaproteobacteria bacterium]|nr:TRAP transporter small permease [Deltaproteobacteria bacterium]